MATSSNSMEIHLNRSHLQRLVHSERKCICVARIRAALVSTLPTARPTDRPTIPSFVRPYNQPIYQPPARPFAYSCINETANEKKIQKILHSLVHSPFTYRKRITCNSYASKVIVFIFIPTVQSMYLEFDVASFGCVSVCVWLAVCRWMDGWKVDEKVLYLM